MNNIQVFKSFLIVLFLSFGFCCCTDSGQRRAEPAINYGAGNLKIGWSIADITPDETVLIRTLSISEGVLDPILATVLVMESGSGASSEKVIMVSCDLLGIPDGRREVTEDNLLNNVRRLVVKSVPELKPEQIFLNATHTHSAPNVSSKSIEDLIGMDFNLQSPKEYLDIISVRIADSIAEAWNRRRPGGISYGLGFAVAGHNRIQVDFSGEAQMHGNINRPGFSHLEGFVDHSVNLLFTWDETVNITGVVINMACTSQFTYGNLISSDYWHDVREEMAKRFDNKIYILTQSSPAGDQSCHDIIVDRRAEDRMQKLMFPDEENERLRRRKDMALRISDAVTSVLPYMKDSIEWDPVFKHEMRIAELSKRIITKEEVKAALDSYPGVPKGAVKEDYQKQYDEALLELKNNPELKGKREMFNKLARNKAMIRRAENLEEHFRMQSIEPKYPVEIHVVRIGDIVFATNPFELYMDFGTRIKARSPAIQTFLVQLAGNGTYLPTFRAVAGKAYGAIPASNVVGPEGGQELVENTLEIINALWEK